LDFDSARLNPFSDSQLTFGEALIKREARVHVHSRQEPGFMITICREQDESIVINDNIIVTVIEIHDDEVCLEIEHPGDVSVERGELLATTGHEAN
jgi:carbon storage regulator